jgi:hypothetical protein
VLTYFNRFITRETAVNNYGLETEESLFNSRQEKYLFVFPMSPERFCNLHNLVFHGHQKIFRD